MIRKTAMLGLLVIIVFAVASCSEDSTGPKEIIQPTVDIKSPKDGSTREGVVDITVDATDNVGIKHVELTIGSAAPVILTSAPYTYEWDMGSVSTDASVTIKVKAVDTSGNLKVSEVTVTKGASKAPTATIENVTMQNPVGDSIMQGYLLVITGSATDVEDGVLGDADIKWYSDLQGELGTGGKTLNYRGLVIGKHTITITATDSDGVTDEDTVEITVIDNDQDFAYVQEGTYIIGGTLFDSRPVEFKKPFLVSKTELSFKQFLSLIEEDDMAQPYKDIINKEKRANAIIGEPDVLNGTGYPIDLFEGSGAYDNYPVCFVTIAEIIQFCQSLSRIKGYDPAYRYLDKDNEVVELKDSDKVVLIRGSDGFGFANGWRLPTEAEWEVAASGGDADRIYPWGNIFGASKCNSLADMSPPSGIPIVNGKGITPIDSYEQSVNPFGLYNIAGNVAEMCSDMYTNEQNEFPYGIDPHPFDESDFVWYIVKGGCWFENSAQMKIGIRSTKIPYTYKAGKELNEFSAGIGARLVKTLEVGEDPWVLDLAF